jgi:short-subunit dehydrogenase
MRDNGGGAIVNISSIAAHVGFPDCTAYVAAKADVLSPHAGAQTSLAG